MVKGIFIAILCFILFSILHLVIAHNFNIKRRFRTLFIIWLGSFLCYILMFTLVQENIFSPIIKQLSGMLKAIDFLYGIIIYGSVLLFYLNLIIFADRSISTKMMVDIENAPSKKLTLEQIKHNYNLSEKISYELEDIKYAGFMSEDSGYFKNTAKGAQYAKLMKFLKDYLKLGLR